MALRSADGAPIVEVGSSTGDQPSWTRIGVIAAIGFIVGVAWPRLAGVRLGPSLPEGAASSSAAVTAAVAEPSAKAAAPAPAVLAAEAPVKATAPTASGLPAVGTGVPAAPASAAPAVTLPAPSAAALRSAQVEWEVALVRDEPKTGKIVGRLPRGTDVRVGSAKDGWYPVKYGSGYASEGWVYRGAIGR